MFTDRTGLKQGAHISSRAHTIRTQNLRGYSAHVVTRYCRNSFQQKNASVCALVSHACPASHANTSERWSSRSGSRGTQRTVCERRVSLRLSLCGIESGCDMMRAYRVRRQQSANATADCRNALEVPLYVCECSPARKFLFFMPLSRSSTSPHVRRCQNIRLDNTGGGCLRLFSPSPPLKN